MHTENYFKNSVGDNAWRGGGGTSPKMTLCDTFTPCGILVSCSPLLHVIHTGVDYFFEVLIMYSRIHEKLLILYFENARGAAPSVLKEKNQQFRVYSTT